MTRRDIITNLIISKCGPEAVHAPCEPHVAVVDVLDGPPLAPVLAPQPRLHAWGIRRQVFTAFVLMDSGVREPFAFQDADLDKITGAMKTGTRVVVLTSPENCDGVTLNPLLAKGFQTET